MGGFPGWLAGPFSGLAPAPLGGAFWLLLLGMTACYLGALALAGEIGARPAIGCVVGMHVVFALAPPLLTTDPFGYLGYARLAVLEGVSPYESGLDALAEGDPVRAFFGWERGRSPYGPLFTVASYPLAPLGVPAGLWAVKVSTAAASLAGLAVLWRLAPALGRPPVAALVFAGLNPVLLVWGVAGAHNDLLVSAVLLGSLALLVRGREGAGAAVAAAAAGIKASAGVVLPLLVVGARARARALGGVMAGLGAGAVLGLATLGVDGMAGYPRALAEQADFASDNSLLHLVGAALGLGGANGTVRLAAGIVLVVGIALLCLWLARSRSRPDGDRRLVAAWGWATLLVLLTTAWLMVWYVVLLLPLAALAPGRGLRAATLALCAFVVLMRTPSLFG